MIKGSFIRLHLLLLKGTKVGTVTNSTGNYSFTINEKGLLVFSYAGYENKEIKVAGDQTMNVSLTPGNTKL